MCDYSLESLYNRPAKVGDKLVTTNFGGLPTRGLSAPDAPKEAVCMRPGTQLVFDEFIKVDTTVFLLGYKKTTTLQFKDAKFVYVNEMEPGVHHDAIETPDGKHYLLNKMALDQKVTVLQLPYVYEEKHEVVTYSALEPQPAE